MVYMSVKKSDIYTDNVTLHILGTTINKHKHNLEMPYYVNCMSKSTLNMCEEGAAWNTVQGIFVNTISQRMAFSHQAIIILICQ